jgi:hypothetical protein
MRTNCGHEDRYANGRCRECKKLERQRRKGARREYAKTWNVSLRGRALTMVTAARVRAKERKMPRPEVDVEWVAERLSAGVCEVSGIPFSDVPGDPRRPSLDRRDATKAYTKENSRVILWALNAAFSDWGEDVFRPIVRAWLIKDPGCDLI